MRAASVAFILAVTLLSGCADEPTKETGKECTSPTLFEPDEHPVIIFETTMGELVIDLYEEHAPRTSAWFACLAQSGIYEGTIFDQTYKDRIIKGGDPNTKSQIGPIETQARIPDEFHHNLRHEGRGVVSTANPIRGAVGTEFFIILSPQPGFDDQQTVFGQLRGGSEILDEIDDKITSLDGEPRDILRILSARVEIESKAPATDFPVTVWTPTPQLTVPKEGGKVRFVVGAGHNGLSGHLLNVTLTNNSLEAAIEPGFQQIPLPAQQRVAFLVEMIVPEGTQKTYSEVLTVASETDRKEVTLTVHRLSRPAGEPIDVKDEITVHYFGVVPDGRLFDTTMENIALSAGSGWFGHFKPRAPGDYQPYKFVVGSKNQIEGFATMPIGLTEGQSWAARIPVDRAYGWGPCVDNFETEVPDPCLNGVPLIFYMEVLAHSANAPQG